MKTHTTSRAPRTFEASKTKPRISSEKVSEKHPQALVVSSKLSPASSREGNITQINEASLTRAVFANAQVHGRVPRLTRDLNTSSTIRNRLKLSDATTDIQSLVADISDLGLIGSAEIDAAELLQTAKMFLGTSKEAPTVAATARALLRLEAYEELATLADLSSVQPELWSGIEAYAKENNLPIKFVSKTRSTVDVTQLYHSLEESNQVAAFSIDPGELATYLYMNLERRSEILAKKHTPQPESPSKVQAKSQGASQGLTRSAAYQEVNELSKAKTKSQSAGTNKETEASSLSTEADRPLPPNNPPGNNPGETPGPMQPKSNYLLARFTALTVLGTAPYFGLNSLIEGLSTIWDPQSWSSILIPSVAITAARTSEALLAILGRWEESMMSFDFEPAKFHLSSFTKKLTVSLEEGSKMGMSYLVTVGALNLLAHEPFFAFLSSPFQLGRYLLPMVFLTVPAVEGVLRGVVDIGKIIVNKLK